MNRNLAKTAKSLVVTRERIVHYLAIFIIMENSFAKTHRTVREHYDKIAEDYGVDGELPLSQNFFERMRTNIKPDRVEMKKLCSLIVRNSQKLIYHINAITIDETTIGYQPSSLSKERAINQGTRFFSI